MFTAPPAGASSSQPQFQLFVAKIALSLFLISGSGFLGFLPIGNVLRLIFIVLQVTIAFYGIGIAFIRQHIVVASLSLIMMLAIPFYAYVFSMAARQPFVPVSGGDYLPIGLTSLFYLVLRNGQGQDLVRFLMRVSAIYAVAYILLWAGVTFGLVHPADGAKIVLKSGGDTERGDRIALLSCFIIFGMFCATASFVRSLRFLALVQIALFAICLFLSGSRLISAMTILAFGLYLVTQTSQLVRTVFFPIFLIGFLTTCFMIITHSFNPFDSFVNENTRFGDVSAWARWKDIALTNALIPDHWVFGLGLPNGVEGYGPITHVNYFYTQDIGILGVFMTFGVFGLLLYGFICFAACFGSDKLQIDPIMKIGLNLTGAVLAVYSLLAPVFTGSAIPFAALFMALVFWQPASFEVEN
ncbi:hypothetical protein [Novosphingobium sediminicola]|uniref:O-antigen polymerase n=1 Tax=Novosphingobium sediminicola TaxID=563162 RepID=A0A7W6CHD5_9SPHN|nr:hypothetical protein [Novosphingobium sediminicola]MBB3955515.1 hypothetical protein [Novosphingobium sediminicola]